MPHKIIHYLHHILLTFPVFCILCVFTAHMFTSSVSYIMRIISEHVSRRGQGRGQADLKEGVLWRDGQAAQEVTDQGNSWADDCEISQSRVFVFCVNRAKLITRNYNFSSNIERIGRAMLGTFSSASSSFTYNLGRVFLRIDCYFRAHMEYKRTDGGLKINREARVYTPYAHENSNQSLYLHFLHNIFLFKQIF